MLRFFITSLLFENWRYLRVQEIIRIMRESIFTNQILVNVKAYYTLTIR